LTEFEEALGDEWKLGNGKVDWREYRQGKVKSGLGKFTEQSRCYVHLVNESLVKELDARFLAIAFHDKAGTHKNPDLKHLPPTIGFAPIQRTPLNVKVRADNRQGTIDTDPEFVAFLEAETQPIVKPAAIDSVTVEKDTTEKVQVKSTPLIDALREKKANKAKAAASKEDRKDGKVHSKKDSKDAAVLEKDGKGGKTRQQKVDQASKEAVKALNKQIASKQQPQQRAASPSQTTSTAASPSKSKKPSQQAKTQSAQHPQATSPAATTAPASTAQTSTPQRQRQRGTNADGIKKMLQKDLGIKPKAIAQKSQAAPSPAPTAIIQAGSKDKRPSTPTAQPSGVAKAPSGPKAQSQPSANTSSHKAYLKHANPSQGMTEILIQQALSHHGDVVNVTIDPRKGTAIAIFKTADGMKKALDAKKVTVANGTVEVLEFKDRNANSGGSAGGRGGLRGGRGGGRSGRSGAVSGAGQGSGAAPAPAKADGQA
jgi:regulator of nonsense transcripts 3